MLLLLTFRDHGAVAVAQWRGQAFPGRRETSNGQRNVRHEGAGIGITTYGGSEKNLKP